MNSLSTIATMLVLSASAAPAHALQAPGPFEARQRPMFVQAPRLVPNSNPSVPLAAMITFETSVMVRTELAFKEGQRSWVREVEEGFGLTHRVPVLGVRPGRTHWITVWVTDQNGERTAATEPVVFQTPQLPSNFPPLTTNVSEPSSMEPGVTLININSSREDESFLMILDAEGEVIWFYRAQQYLGDVQRLRSGNILYMYDRTTIAEINMFGDVVQEWFAAALSTKGASATATLVDVNVFHHDVIELPEALEADFMALSTEMRVFPAYPADEVDQSTVTPHAQVVGDIVVEFKRDGTIVNEWRLLDILDPYRVCYDSLADTWGSTYQTETRDWSHGNSIFFDATDDSWIYSARHQESVVKVRRGDGGIEWILSPHGRWRAPWQDLLLQPEGGPFAWNYHQHAAEITPSGTLLMFDNGNHRAVPPDPALPDWQLYSRAVEYAVDAESGTVRQVWEYGGSLRNPWFSHAYGDADAQRQTGNVLITDGAREPTPECPRAHVRLIEVTHDDVPRVVWDVLIADSAPFGDSWSAYRAERLSSVYPGL